MRLDKFLVATGVGTRSQVKLLLKKKAIFVNQKV
ncbi:TPA: S4 domain-containing protein, partial [Streptococcus pyogenes]